MSNQSKSNQEYKNRAKLLKKAGFIKHYDLRQQLTDNQKRSIRRLWNNKYQDGHLKSKGWGEILSNPDIYVKKRVSKETLKIARESDYHVKGHSIYVNSGGAKSIKIRGREIIKTHEDGKEVTDLMLSGPEILKYLESKLDDDLPHGEFVTVRIGDNAAFGSIVIDSYHALHQYITRWRPHNDNDDTRTALINQMAIVRYTKELPPSTRELKKQIRKRKNRTFKSGRR